MNTQQLEEVVEKTFGACRQLLIVKGGEYAGEGDRLANFKRGAERVGVKPLTILHIYLSKHLDAIDTYVRKAQTGQEQVLSEPIEGRIDDAINYLLLAKGIIAEGLLADEQFFQIKLHNGHIVTLAVQTRIDEFMSALTAARVSKYPQILVWEGFSVDAYCPPNGLWVSTT